jgi:hypothetical protein
MPSLVHDAFVTLFRNRPTLAPELLRDVLRCPVPEFDRVSVGDASLTEVVPTEYRADLVLLLQSESPGEPRAAIVVEAQLGRDADKRWSWPVYLAGLRARLRCEVALLVVTADASVAAWASTPIPTGHPGWTLTPLVLGPAAVPVIRDDTVASRSPELAVLSVMTHGHDPDAVAIAQAALVAVRQLEDERAKLYADLVLLSVGEAARAILEALMASGTYEYQSDFARRYVAQGEAQGEAKGRAHALLTVLAARGIEVTDAVRTRITACTDLEALDRWLASAVTAQSIGDIVGE